MKHFLKLFLAGTAALLSGCLPASIHPFYTADDLVFEPALIGRWAEPDDENTSLSFTKAGDGKSYELIVTEKDGRSRISGHLMKLDGALYLDMMPILDTDMPDFQKMYLLPMHWLYKVKSIQPTFEMASLDPEWLVDLVEEAPETLKHEWVSNDGGDDPDEKRLILTASTKDLQAFIIKHANDEDAWDNDSTEFVKATSVQLR